MSRDPLSELYGEILALEGKAFRSQNPGLFPEKPVLERLPVPRASMNSVLNIEELFTKGLFRVPDYQRGYAWEQRQLEEFLEDIELLPPGKYHYTGTIVLHQSPELNALPWQDDEGREYTAFAVVDGQQRLTTIVLFLNAIREVLEGMGQGFSALARGLRTTYIAATDPAGQPLYRLALNNDCQDYFVAEAIGDRRGSVEASIQAHDRLGNATAFFAAYLKRQREEQGEQFHAWLTGVRNKVVHQLKVSVHLVEEEAEVGMIFEVLNNRGKPLSELEKVKNYLLYLASKLHLPRRNLESYHKEVNEAWTHIFKRLMEAGLTSAADEDQLLRSHWLFAFDPSSRNWDGSKSIKALFSLRDFQGSPQELLQKLRDYVFDLDSASLAFCEARRPARTNSFDRFNKKDPELRDGVVRSSEKLRRVNVIAPFLPLLIAYRLKAPDDPQAYLDLVRLCEAYAFRVFRFIGNRSNAGQSALFRLAYRFFTQAITHEEVLDELRGLIHYYCPDDAFSAGFGLGEHENNWYGWSGLKYFLYEYEEHLANNKRVDLSWDAVEQRDLEQTIEHILPQTPTDSYWTERFDEALRRRYTHDLGNLCLTSDNSSYGNKPFPQKCGEPGSSQPCYANSNLFMERDLYRFGDWDESAIRQRREEMVSWALKRWRVEAVPAAERDVAELARAASDEEAA